MNSCSSLLQPLPKSKNSNTALFQKVQVYCFQMQIELRMLSFWLCYHIKLPDSQLPRTALTHFNATNVSVVKDKI